MGIRKKRREAIASFHNMLLNTLFYDCSTGIFTSKNKRCGPVPKNSKIGSIDNYGYQIITVGNTRYKAHRLAWFYKTGKWPVGEIDHINHNRSDNRFENLQDVTHTENMKNRKLDIRNKSGVCGVFWNKRLSKWEARIVVNKKKKHLGVYKNKELAVFVRKEAEDTYSFNKNHGKRYNE